MGLGGWELLDAAMTMALSYLTARQISLAGATRRRPSFVGNKMVS